MMMMMIIIIVIIIIMAANNVHINLCACRTVESQTFERTVLSHLLKQDEHSLRDADSHLIHCMRKVTSHLAISPAL